MKPNRCPTPKQMQSQCDRFNTAHAVGGSIWVAPGDVRSRYEEVQIAAPGAYLLGGHTAVVQVTDGHGCIALSHVRVREGGARRRVSGALIVH